MIIEIFSTHSKDISSKGERTGDRGDLCVIREYSTEHEVYYASRESPAEPWRVTLNPLRLRWLKAAKPLLRAMLEAGGPVWVKIQAPEGLTTGKQVVWGLCSTIQEVEGHWRATTGSGKRWKVWFTENPPEPQYVPGITMLIKAALKAAQGS